MTYKHFLGDFDSLEEVWQRYPSGGQEGDYLNVDGQILRWNDIENQWTPPAMVVPPSSRNTENVFSDLNVENDLSVGGVLRARVVRGRSASCGLFVDEAALLRNFPKPLVGQWALVLINGRTSSDGNAIGEVYYCQQDGQWQDAGFRGGFDGEYDAIFTEKEERKEGDATLKRLIDNEHRQLEKEKKDRKDADDALGVLINKERQDRSEAITNLSQLLHQYGNALADMGNAIKGVEKDIDDVSDDLNGQMDDIRKSFLSQLNELKSLIEPSVNDLQNQINSLEIAGVALSNEFGENKNIGISQWALSHWARTIQQKIDELTGENSRGMYMTISRDYVVGDTGTIHITASSEGLTGIFDHIALYANNQIILEQSAVGFVHYNLEITETTIITCVAKIMGENFVESKTVSYFPKAFYLGGGDSYLDVFNQAHLVPVNGDSQRGSYDIHLNQGDHIIILLDNSLDEEFIAAYMDGFEIPFTSEDVTIDGDSYHFLLSENIYAEDTYNIDIVVNSETPNTDNNE